MSLNRKGIGWETVGKWIFALIVIAILWVLILNLGDFLYGTGSKAACQNWVYRNSVNYAKEVFSGGQSPCLTTQETIKDIDKNKVYEKIAQNMYTCWDQYGQGEIDFYSNIDWGPGNLYCRICSEIKFSDDVKQKIKEIDVDEFEIYLNDHNPPNTKITYAEFFTKTDRAKIDLGNTPLNIESGNLYSTFLVYKRSSGLTAETVGFTLGACAVGAQIGAAVGTVFAPVTGTTGCAIGMIGVLFTKSTSIGDTLYPSIIIFKSNSENIAKACNYVYYNPEKKPLDFLNKN